MTNESVFKFFQTFLLLLAKLLSILYFFFEKMFALLSSVFSEFLTRSFHFMRAFLKTEFKKTDSASTNNKLIHNQISLLEIQQPNHSVKRQRVAGYSLYILRKSYLENPYPSNSTKQELAFKTTLNYSQVSFWFSNERKKNKLNNYTNNITDCISKF